MTELSHNHCHWAFLSLGSNLGDRRGYLTAAEARLARIGQIVAQSKIYETDPVGYISQPQFLNQVVKLETICGPRELLNETRSIENALGRTRSFPFAPRTIDIDIILYEDLIIDEPGLIIPHPRMHERRFVLTPLLELTPHLVHPRMEKPMAALEAISLGNIHLA
jgi:2-amino-4-hydroxy-6-hydroxymethyldihydropteridine diphosphokinase